MLVSLAVGAAQAQTQVQRDLIDPGEGPFVLTADRVDYDTDREVAVAEGKVEISRGARRLLADRVTYEVEADRVVAEGNVVLVEPTGEVLFADRVVMTGDLRDGTVERLRMLMEDDSRLTSPSGERRDGNRTIMQRVTYSPCRLCPDGGAPLWQLRARRVTHDQADRRVDYRHVFIDFFGVPLAYTPYFSHPDPTVERQTGFLAPTFRRSNEIGFAVNVPYFINLAPNRDITLEPIFTTEAGTVLTGEYRALLPTGRGTYRLFGSVVDDPDGSDPQDERGLRGHFEGNGRFTIDDERHWGFNSRIASDDNYLRRYDFSRDSVLRTRGYVERLYGPNYFALNGVGFQGLRPDDDQDVIPVALPLAEMNWRSDPLPLGSRVEASGNILALTRQGGRDTRRLSGTADWVLPRMGPLGDLWRLRTGLRADAYDIQGDPDDEREDDGSQQVGRLIPGIGAEWSWPLVAEMGRFNPIIEPLASLAWSPDGMNDDDIPNEDSIDFELDTTNIFRFDRLPGLDLVEEGLRASYGMRLGVVGPRGGELSAVFGQSYSFTDESAFSEVDGVGDGASDYVGRVDFAPTGWLDLNYRFRLDRDDLELERQELGAFAGPPRVRVAATYTALTEDRLEDDFESREELTLGARVGITPSLALIARTRRDLENDRAIESGLGFVYTNYCLVLELGAERTVRNSTDGNDDTTIAFRLTLRNLGEIGTGNL